MKILVIFIAVANLVGCVNHQQKLQDEGVRYLAMSKDEHKGIISIKDDALEPVVVLDTQSGFKQQHGLANIIWNDFFLRGYIDKKTGNKQVQVYAALVHQSGSWLQPYQANYGAPLQTVATESISSNVDCTAKNLYGSCKYWEHVGFIVADSELKRIEKAMESADPATQIWQFKIKTRSGRDVQDIFTGSEFAALLEKMDEYNPIASQ